MQNSETFEPPGLMEDLKLQEARTNDEAFRLITQSSRLFSHS